MRDYDARDWKDRNVKLDGTVTGHGARLHVHHFFPRALLRKQPDLKTKDINTFGNYVVISADANLDVLTEEPATYIPRFKIPDAELRKQCIPAERELWHVNRYDDVIRERRRLLAEAANEFLEA